MMLYTHDWALYRNRYKIESMFFVGILGQVMERVMKTDMLRMLRD